MRFAALCAMTLLGCSPGSGSEDVASEARGGARLRPVVLKSDDGLHVVVGFHDREIGVDCLPNVASDGVTRCLPATQAYDLGDGKTFADETCSSTPVTFEDPGFRIRQGFILLESVSSSDGCMRSYRARHAAPVNVFYTRERGHCIPHDQKAGGWQAFAIGEEVTADRFVRLTESPHHTRLHAETYDGDDGSRISLDFKPTIDDAFGLPCSPWLAADHVLRCIPDSTVVGSGIFGDEHCAEPLYGAARCGLFPIWTQFAAPDSTDVRTAYSFGPTVDHGWQTDASTCTPVTLPVPLHRLDEIPAESFVELRRTTFGGTRLRVSAVEAEHRLYAEAGITRVFSPFIDAKTGKDCELLDVDDTSALCIPKPAAPLVYLDATCTTPVAEIYDGVALPELAVESVDGRVVSVRQIRGPARRPATSVFRHVYGECVELFAGLTIVMDVGDPVPLDTFVRVNRVIE